MWYSMWSNNDNKSTTISTTDNSYYLTYSDIDGYEYDKYNDNYSYSTDIDIQEKPEELLYPTKNHFNEENFKYIKAMHSYLKKNIFKNRTFRRQL